MSRTRQFLVAAGTFSVALGIGFVMQNGDALAARFSETAVPTGSPVDGDMVETAMVVAPQTALGPASTIVRQHIADGMAPLVQVAADANPTAPAAPQDIADLVPVILTEEVDQPALDIPDMSVPVIDVVPVLLVLTPDATAPDRPAAPVVEAALEIDPVAPTVSAPLAAAEPNCMADMTATAMPAAMVDLTLIAGCFPDAQVTIHHQGMMFSVITDDAGVAHMTIPALADNAVFIADMGNGEGAVAVATIPDLALYDRAVLQWQGSTGPQIHALEFGAGYGNDGHVWNGAARGPDVALAGSGGFLVHLGDGLGLNPLQAEVYTYPSGDSQRAGTVAFSVETPVTVDNCGTEIAAQTIQVSPGADAFALDLTMTVPTCDAVGEYLVLKNMLLDLTLAAK